MAEFYVTTFCNFAHRVSDGEPIDHECYVLPPEAIKAEMEGDYDKANEILSGGRLKKRRKGVKWKKVKSE